MELNYFAAIEAVLFASGTPVEINRLAEGLGLAPAAMREQLLAYGEQLDRDQRGIRLLFLDDLVQLAARREYDPQIVAVTDLRHNAPNDFNGLQRANLDTAAAGHTG